MGWSLGYDNNWRRDIGYSVPAFCDHPGCSATIDRGLAHVCCRQEPYGGDEGCGLYFCAAHHDWQGQCERCAADPDADGQTPGPFDPKSEHPDWLRHKLGDPSWNTWRREHPRAVAQLRDALAAYVSASANGATSSNEPR